MKSKEYRDGFVEEHVRTGIPFQIRALREENEWTQKQLGEKAEMAQERISVLEDPEYSKFTISTLIKLASAFDVGLMVKFVPFSKILLEEINLSETLVPASYYEDKALQQGEVSAPKFSSANSVSPYLGTQGTLGRVIFGQFSAPASRWQEPAQPSPHTMSSTIGAQTHTAYR